MIKVQNLSKTFGPKIAVNDISFEVERGEVFGFLGPNGAGKSTTMRMVTGFIPPTSGSIKVGAHDMLEQPIQAKRLIGYLPENAPLYADMTVHGFLSFAAEMRGFTGEAKKKAVHRVVEMCFLESVLYQAIDTLSKGYRHRTCFAQSIIHDPDVLVMDEPTDGLDPNQKHEVRALIRHMGEKKAIVFSTHILEEVEAACSRVLIIDRGRIVANGTPDELKRKSELAGAVSLLVSVHPAEEVRAKLSPLPTVRRIAVLKAPGGGDIVRAFPKAGSKNGELARSVAEVAAQEGWKIQELHTEEGRLDEVFRSITLPETTQEKH
ncbi:MAG: ATP-binding cassette domain-containing protein [Candidatus Omnitrophica bacterium]|nr:ATP-binding cassette domain-containing protein [Candidatus Omnitrophota bacterium]